MMLNVKSIESNLFPVTLASPCRTYSLTSSPGTSAYFASVCMGWGSVTDHHSVGGSGVAVMGYSRTVTSRLDILQSK